MNRIIDKKELSPGLFEMVISAPEMAKKAEAGQFLIIRVEEKGERIPLTIADFNRTEGTITIIFQVVGASTERIAELEIGEKVLDFTGPLGTASEIENYGTVVCVGGGVGIAPVYPIARELSAAGNKVITILGARNEDLLFWEEKFSQVSSELLIATDDGSKGQKGFVTDILKQVMEREEVSRVWAIGPVIMMKVVSNVTRDAEIKTIVSMNPIMVDGTGMCGACRVSVGEETKFACVDGPEFDGHLVDFDLAMRRLAYYKDEEKAGHEHQHEHHHHGGGCQCHNK